MKKVDLNWELEYLVKIKKDISAIKEKSKDDEMKEDLEMLWWNITDVYESLMDIQVGRNV